MATWYWHTSYILEMYQKEFGTKKKRCKIVQCNIGTKVNIPVPTSLLTPKQSAPVLCYCWSLLFFSWPLFLKIYVQSLFHLLFHHWQWHADTHFKYACDLGNKQSIKIKLWLWCHVISFAAGATAASIKRSGSWAHRNLVPARSSIAYEVRSHDVTF
jgi:hypothetical protein